jgi:hypothetical protein
MRRALLRTALGTGLLAVTLCTAPAVAHADAPAGVAPATATPDAPAGLQNHPAAEPFSGPDGYVDDPTTTTGLISYRMAHTYQQIAKAFGGRWRWHILCWDQHAWNPTSDHPLGRACDFEVGTFGHFPDAADRAVGWQLAHWAEANTAALGISYVIFDGHIWAPEHAAEGWSRYTGGGIYDPTTPDGGHFDHVHISVNQTLA